MELHQYCDKPSEARIKFPLPLTSHGLALDGDKGIPSLDGGDGAPQAYLNLALIESGLVSTVRLLVMLRLVVSTSRLNSILLPGVDCNFNRGW